MNSLSIQVAQPAPVYLSPQIKSIGIIDRSLPAEKATTMDKIEGILSAETKDLDKKGASAAILGLQAELEASGRFDKVIIIKSEDWRQKGMGVFPATISWNELQNIRKEHELDAIFSLAIYDTDTRVDYNIRPTRVSNPLGGNFSLPRHEASVNTQITNGWRVYDLQRQVLLDEFAINDNIVLTGRGINPMKAVKAVLGRDEAVINLSSQIGEQYALRTIPFNLRVARSYYVRGTKKFKQAKRRAQTGNWDGAAALWKKEVNHRRRKIKGRATYNMAVINEINGDLESAIDWASKAYADYNNKRALRYLRILKYRQDMDRQLELEQY